MYQDFRKLLYNSTLLKRPHCLKITQNVAFEFWHFPPIFVLFKLTCLVTLFDRKLQVFKNSPKWTIFGIINQLLSTHSLTMLNETFFCDFRTSCRLRRKQRYIFFVIQAARAISMRRLLFRVELFCQCFGNRFINIFTHFLEMSLGILNKKAPKYIKLSRILRSNLLNKTVDFGLLD